MAEGKVKWFDKKKGYGFILDSGGDEIFVHYTCFSDSGIQTLDEGEEVCFDVVPGEKGPRAKNVTKRKVAY